MRRQSALLALVVLLAAACTTAWFALDPGAIDRIVVSRVPYAAEDDWQIEIDARNRYLHRHGVVERQGTLPFAPFAARLANVPELRMLPPAAGAGRPGMYLFWIEGRRRTMAPEISSTGLFVDLRAFANDLHDAVVADEARADAPHLRALTSLHELRSVEAESRGCFGTCGTYTVLFEEASNRAMLDWREVGTRGRTERASSAATIAWTDVVSALHEAHVERLEPRYPVHAADTQSAVLRFHFRTWTYTVEAPDSSSWPPEFRDAFTSLRHLAAGARWNPPLAAPQLRTLGR